jgi:hypothetical protein
MGNTFVKTVQENSTQSEEVPVTQEQPLAVEEEAISAQETPVTEESSSTEETPPVEEIPAVEESVATEEIHLVEETHVVAVQEKVEINSLEVGITLLFLSSITEGNPGAHSVMHNLMTSNYDHEFLTEFYKKLIDNKITGSRLWYIYKNECFYNINELVFKDLTPFTDSYFYEKFERLD